MQVHQSGARGGAVPGPVRCEWFNCCIDRAGAPRESEIVLKALSRIPIHQRLSFKLTLAVTAATFGTISAQSYLATRAQQAHLIDEVVRGAAQFSDTIRSSTHDLMLEDQKQDAYRIMAAIGRQEGIEKVRIFNKEGRITYSTDAREQGSFVDTKAESCYACHAAGQPLVRLSLPSRKRVYERGGHRVLGMVTPIYNEAACSTAACHAHPPEKTVLGVVDIGMSLQEIDSGIRTLTRRTVAFSGLAVLALAALVAFSAHRLVFRRVAALVGATQRVARGDLAPALAADTGDELGILARSFNEMGASLAKTRGELEELMNGLERQVEERTAALASAQRALVQTERLASLGQLSASIAHEINNPLAGILTFARLMIRTLEDGPVDAGTRAMCLKNLGLVQRETERCTVIVRNLLDFARARPPDRKRIDVRAPLEEALSLTQHKMQLQGIEIRRDMAASAIVEADFGQLRQAYVNIILNASDAMPKGGALTFTTRVLASEKAVEVAIADTGTGIAPEHLSRVFDPFFTTKEKGTGLGLSVVYGIVQNHGGSMRAESRPGQGTTMTIRLPVAGTEAAPPAGAAPA